MKVLWFTNTPSRYANYGGYNGGGWIYSLEEEMSKIKDINLSIAFFMNGQPKKVVKDKVTYYPIENPFEGSALKKIKGNVVSDTKKEEKWLDSYLKVIRDCKPDIIEVFGTEQSFGQVAKNTKIPVILCTQGMVGPIYNAFLPPSVSTANYIWQDANIRLIHRRAKGIKSFKQIGVREEEITRNVKYFIGRTTFDKRVLLLYNPTGKYYCINEILRDIFYMPSERTIPDKPIIISILSSPLYKGYDTILKTANILKESGLEFEWKIYGNVNPNYIEKKTGIAHNDVNIRLMGVATANQLKESLANSTVYVHLSYIDNSPNSVCEAQMTGIPVIASYVGGIPSLIENRETGFLVPSNDPYQTASVIIELVNDKALNEEIGKKAKEEALKRHDKSTIVKTLMDVYKTIIND